MGKEVVSLVGERTFLSKDGGFIRISGSRDIPSLFRTIPIPREFNYFPVIANQVASTINLQKGDPKTQVPIIDVKIIVDYSSIKKIFLLTNEQKPVFLKNLENKLTEVIYPKPDRIYVVPFEVAVFAGTRDDLLVPYSGPDCNFGYSALARIKSSFGNTKQFFRLWTLGFELSW